MVSENLKDCPFCGGKAEIQSVIDTEDGCEGVIATCLNCGCCTQLCDSKIDAVSCWNERVSRSRENELLKLLAILVDSWDCELNMHSRRMKAILAAKDLLKDYAD